LTPNKILKHLGLWLTARVQSGEVKSRLPFRTYAPPISTKLRFEQHTRGQVSSTRDRRPLELIYYEAYISEEDALRKEKHLKTHCGKMYLKKRFKSYFTG